MFINKVRVSILGIYFTKNKPNFHLVGNYILKITIGIRMIITTTALLCLAISGVTGYNYQAVSTCPAVLGDPTFTTSTVSILLPQ